VPEGVAPDNRAVDQTGTRKRPITLVLPNATATLSTLLIAVHEPMSAQTEALRELRSQLLLKWFSGYQTLAVVAARGGQGCSVVAANLAILFAQLGEQTLLIDANLRAPRQHELFGLKPTAGLSDLLRNKDVHEEAMMPVPSIENLRVLCAGVAPANPQELISRTPLIYLMKTLPDRFGAIIVDTPPALACADAQIVAARTHGALLVARRHRTRLGDVERVQERISSAGAQLLGAVIND
jgi:chain length determinant protein tyrosine kinase EpsG